MIEKHRRVRKGERIQDSRDGGRRENYTGSSFPTGFLLFFLVRRSVIQNTSKVITGFTENIIDLGHARAHADICTLV